MKYITILRGINVGGKNIIKMSDLTDLFLQEGYTEVVTYIQSGNICFTAPTQGLGDLQQKIEIIIKDRFGFDVPTLVLTADNLEQVQKQNPYLLDISEPTDNLYLTFLAEVPSAALLQALPGTSDFLDDYFVSGKYIFLKMAQGYGKTKLNNTFFEKKLKTKATTRNWKTVLKLAEMVALK